MNRKRLLATALMCLAFTLVGLLRRANADATDEIKRLASLMDWKPGTIVADIGAGDGRYAFAAAQLVGPSGKIFATEIDEEKLASTEIRSGQAAPHQRNRRRQQRSRNQSPRRMLRRHLFAPRLSPPNQARSIRPVPAALPKTRRPPGHHRISATLRARARSKESRQIAAATAFRRKLSSKN